MNDQRMHKWVKVRRVLGLLAVLGSGVLFYQAVTLLVERDYVSCAMLVVTGFTGVQVATRLLQVRRT